MVFLLYFALFHYPSFQHCQSNQQLGKVSESVSDETYIGALRGALRTLRTIATMLGRLDEELQESWDAHNVEWALALEQILAEHEDRRRPLAKSLLLTTSLLEVGG